MKISECCNNSLLSRFHPGNGVSVLFLAKLGQLNMKRKKLLDWLSYSFSQTNIHIPNISVLYALFDSENQMSSGNRIFNA